MDVGNRLFHRITRGRWAEAVEQWKRGDTSSRECLIHECSLARATREEVLRFALDQPVDPGFAPLVAWGEDHGWRVRVVSDGLAVYIRAILEREGFGRLPVESNRVHFYRDFLLPSFPFAGRGCGRCGNCKGRAVEEARPHGPVIFIGDGLSDRCGARAADVVFARAGKDLEGFCRDAGIAHIPYGSFGEILARLQDRFPLREDAGV